MWKKKKKNPKMLIDQDKLKNVWKVLVTVKVLMTATLRLISLIQRKK